MDVVYYIPNSVLSHSPCTQRACCVGQVHDIEDLITGGKVGKICPYFSARELAKTAELVFCPYRCVVGRIIRL